MTVKIYSRLALVLGFIALVSSCNKTDNNVPVISGPALVLTYASDTGYAGDQIEIDYSATATHGIKRIQIFTQYLTNPKIKAEDTTFATTKPVIDYNFIYFIPDSAVRGQQSYITITITDGDGNSTTKTATATVTGSRPSISVTPASITAHKGDTISYTVLMKSPDKFIQTLNVAQVINGGSATNLPSVPFPGTNKVESTIYKYQVPASSVIGDKIGLVFKVANTSGVTNFTTTSITVN